MAIFVIINTKIMIISHVKSNTHIIQSNEEHSLGVAKLAEKFSDEFGLGSWGWIMGMLHDKGKEQKSFQTRIKRASGLEEGPIYKAPHAYVGALISRKLYPNGYPLLNWAIMCHHSGLSDYTDFENTIEEKQIPDDVKIESDGRQLTAPKCPYKMDKKDWHHLQRLLFSCLVDADYLDTETFMQPETASHRGSNTPLCELLPLLEKHMENFSLDAPINKIRNEILNQCNSLAQGQKGFYSLTVPTGGGKTLASISWAMRHAIHNGQKRIIIAIPYTSIIVQTASVLRSIFGGENVLEHHSNANIDRISDEEQAVKMKLATENWDYPIIVTTNVELFESMFSNKTSSCRKLHNICNSVLILDEVQTLPLEFLQPIVDSLKTYQKIFGTSVLFTTASLPALKGNIGHGHKEDEILHGFDNIKEIIPDSFKLYERLRRVNLHFDDSKSNYNDIAARLTKYDRVLCIVNTRKDAMEIFKRLPNEGITLHLSRMMCSKHIRKTIESIKELLLDDNQKIIRVVATQLIEAGVDIDFPIVFRQEAGLDSILQAAGRCNREGKLGISDSYVFMLDKPLPKGYISNAVNAQKNLPKDKDWFAPQTMIQYFTQLYSRTVTFDKADIANSLYKPFDFCFETVAQKFKLIDDSSISVIVNYENSYELVTILKDNGVNYHIMKKLSQYSVNIHEKDFKELDKAGLIDEVLEGIYFLPDIEQYDKDLGLVVQNHWLEEILIK